MPYPPEQPSPDYPPRPEIVGALRRRLGRQPVEQRTPGLLEWAVQEACAGDPRSSFLLRAAIECGVALDLSLSPAMGLEPLLAELTDLGLTPAAARWAAGTWRDVFATEAPARERPLADDGDLGTAILELLRREAADTLHLAPQIPVGKLHNARRYSVVPLDEDILGLLDCTVFGSATHSLLFGYRGIYYYNDWACSISGPGAISYHGLAHADLRPLGLWELEFEAGKLYNVAGGAMSRDRLLELLGRLQDVIRDHQGAARVDFD